MTVASEYDYYVSQVQECKAKQQSIKEKRRIDGRRFFSVEEKAQLEELREDYNYYMDLIRDLKKQLKN